MGIRIYRRPFWLFVYIYFSVRAWVVLATHTTASWPFKVDDGWPHENFGGGHQRRWPWCCGMGSIVLPKSQPYFSLLKWKFEDLAVIKAYEAVRGVFCRWLAMEVIGPNKFSKCAVVEWWLPLLSCIPNHVCNCFMTTERKSNHYCQQSSLILRFFFLIGQQLLNMFDAYIIYKLIYIIYCLKQ